MISPILEKLNPAPDALLSALMPLIDDTMLQEIARADYGEDEDKHLAQLRRVRDDQALVSEQSWYPHEVLALNRWSEPEHDWAESDPQYLRHHVMRAFSCAALLRAYDDADTLAQLLASLPLLGHPFQEAALRFLAWCVQERQDSYSDRLFNILALLALVLQIQAPVTTVELETLIDYLYVVEREVRQEASWPQPPPPWLLGNVWLLRPHVWQQVGKEIGTYAATYKDTYIELALLDIASLLQRDASY